MFLFAVVVLTEVLLLLAQFLLLLTLAVDLLLLRVMLLLKHQSLISHGTGVLLLFEVSSSSENSLLLTLIFVIFDLLYCGRLSDFNDLRLRNDFLCRFWIGLRGHNFVGLGASRVRLHSSCHLLLFFRLLGLLNLCLLLVLLLV